VESLLFTEARLREAFAKVRRNSDCAGADGLTPSTYSIDLDSHLHRLRDAIEAGGYRPQPLRAIPLILPGKKPRTLAVPTVADRVAQTAVALALTPVFDARFSEASYGYRPARSVAFALAALEEHAMTRPVLVDADIQDFFGSIGHARLEALIDAWIPEEKLRALARLWIAQHEVRPGRGIALGSPISPLFANLYLDELDRVLCEAGHTLVRYADDFVVACRNDAEASSALLLTGKTLAGMDLELNAAKTRVLHWREGIDFLGAHLGAPRLWSPARDSQRSIAPEPVHSARPASATAAMSDAPPPLLGSRSDYLTVSGGRVKTALVTLYVTEPGCLLKREGERIVVSKKGEERASFPVIKIDQVILLAQSALTAGALALLDKHRIPLLVDDPAEPGTPSMFAAAAGVEIMEHQFERARDPAFALDFAKRVVAGKIANARTVLRRYAREHGANAIRSHELALAQVGGQVARAPSLEVLRGSEGFAAKSYFAAFRCWLPEGWGFAARATRPPPDPFNAVLSLGYTLLLQNVAAFIQAAGLHPQIGFLHARRPGHPALASDLMEEFRPVVVDSLVLNLALNGRIVPMDFTCDRATGLRNRLLPDAKKRFIGSFEEKLCSRITHEDSDQPVNIRQALNLQVRRALATICKGVPYRPFRVR